MKLLQKISIRFLIISAVLFCYGLDTYSGEFANLYSIEISEGNSNHKNNAVSDNDPFVDDQIPQTDNCRLFSLFIVDVLNLQDEVLIPDSHIPVWLPPKI